MILVGIENCGRCKILKTVLGDVTYVELKKKTESTEEILKIKRAMGKLNPTLDFPVVLSDDMQKIVLTEDLLNNLNKQNIENKLLEN